MANKQAKTKLKSKQTNKQTPQQTNKQANVGKILSQIHDFDVVHNGKTCMCTLSATTMYLQTFHLHRNFRVGTA